MTTINELIPEWISDESRGVTLIKNTEQALEFIYGKAIAFYDGEYYHFLIVER